MTALLVSVRDADEARSALAGGADVIDVKDPRRGALGYADPSIWADVQSAVGDSAKLSAALGELLTDPVEDLAIRASGFHYAKLGLAGCGLQMHWQERWRKVLCSLPAGVAPVAVAYADWQFASAPAPHEVLAAANEAGLRLMLIDTFDKRAGNLPAHLSRADLERLASDARELRIGLALAGSLTLELLSQLAPLAPDFFAVRGAACRGDRLATVDRRLVAKLAAVCRSGCSVAPPDSRAMHRTSV